MFLLWDVYVFILLFAMSSLADLSWSADQSLPHPTLEDDEAFFLQMATPIFPGTTKLTQLVLSF